MPVKMISRISYGRYEDELFQIANAFNQFYFGNT